MVTKKFSKILSLLLLVATVYYSFYSLVPQNNFLKTTENSFLTENALQYVKEIASKPHFTGSVAHKEVKQYLINELQEMGLSVEVQTHLAMNKKWRAATNVVNIISKIKGTSNEKALLLLAHYDSNPHSAIGASDDASGVAVILEAVRSFLATNKQPLNDVIICFTDAEELGLLGANAFVKYHPWAKDVGLALNFEARGSSGPSYMLLETNGGNKKLIEAFQKANTPFPVANSLMYSIYKMLPNDTDLTVFREEGNINGFNFAFIGNHFDYHTAQDSYERMDVHSLNHQASYLISTLNYFANNSLENLNSKSDYVYFNFPLVGLVYYPFLLVIPILIISILVFLSLLFMGFKRNKLSLKGILNGFIPLLLSLIISVTFAFYGWKLLKVMYPQYNDILQGFTYNGYLYIAIFALLTLTLCLLFYKKYFKKLNIQDLLIAPLFFWLMINVLIAVYLKGAGFFILPVISMELVLAVLIFGHQNRDFTFLFTIITIPTLLVFVPFIKMFPVGLGLKILPVSAILTVLIFSTMLPVFKIYKNEYKLAFLFGISAFFLFVEASNKSTYSKDRKLPNSILYVLDANKNVAYWASYNNRVDDFTKQFLGENPSKGSYDSSVTASKYHTKIKLFVNTNVKDLEKPIIIIKEDSSQTNFRKVTLTFYSKRNANKVEFISNIPLELYALNVNGESRPKNANGKARSIEYGTVLSYYRTSPDELITIEMEAPKSQKFDFDVLEVKYDLFTNHNFSILPRRDYMMPMPFVTNDATIIKTQLKF